MAPRQPLLGRNMDITSLRNSIASVYTRGSMHMTYMNAMAALHPNVTRNTTAAIG